MTNLLYEQLRKEYLKHHREDAAYKSFSEVFSRLVGERLVQSSVSSNVQNQQKDGPPHIETMFLNTSSSGDKGPVTNTDTQRVDSARNSERQTSGASEDVPPRRETINLNAFSSVDKGPVNNANTRHVDSVGNS